MSDSSTAQDTKLVGAAAREVLETMFFAMVEEEIPETAAEETLYARVRFDGEWSGTLWIAVSAESARAMASDFLGLFGEEASPEQVRHVLGELVNMVCGAALSRLHPDGSFNLQTPEVLAEEEYAPAAESLEVELGLEHGSVKLTLACHG